MCDHCGCRNLTPIARLMDEHDRLRELSTHIRGHLTSGDDAAARAHFDELLVVLGPHVMKEEGVLFPLLRRSDDLAEHVGVLEAEHAGLYDDVDDLDDAGAPAWHAGVLRVLDDLAEHMYKEDFGLFPAALATVDGDEWDAMDRWEQQLDGAGNERSPVSTPVHIGRAGRAADLPCGVAVQVGLHHHGEQRLVDSPPPLQQRGEERPGP